MALTEQRKLQGEISRSCCGEERDNDWLQGKSLEKMVACREEPPFSLAVLRGGVFSDLCIGQKARVRLR